MQVLTLEKLPLKLEHRPAHSRVTTNLAQLAALAGSSSSTYGKPALPAAKPTLIRLLC